ncbi:MAG: energy transducer TonB [Ignavibacteria bacterium]|jgi:protein TonB
MKILKILFCLLFIISIGYSQEKVEKMPSPIGGIEAIMKNVEYPKEAKENEIEGKVLVKAVIDKEGNVVKTELLKSENELLVKAAINAIEKTKFIPGEDKSGNKIAAEITIPVKF